jgi:hypothetical protein
LTGCARAPGPDDTVRNAYAWYVRELKSGLNPLEQKRTELKEFVTDGFLVSIDNMRPELEASPFMDAQSFDAKLSIEKITKDSRAATVRIRLNGRISGQHVLNVYLVKVEGRWKVDDVKAVEEFSLVSPPKEIRFRVCLAPSPGGQRILAGWRKPPDLGVKSISSPGRG